MAIGGKTGRKVEAYAKANAFDLGRRAFQEQLPPGSKPFPAASEDGKAWAAGYQFELEKALKG